MLRKIRIALAALFLVGITLLFFGIGAQWWGWMAKIQIVPSCLALNFAVLAVIVVVTLLAGRVYCAVICPLGVFQDLALSIRQKLGKAINKSRVKHGRKPLAGAVKKFEYHAERPWLRYTVMVLFIAGILAGVQVLIALIAPYSAYGRIVRSVIETAAGNAGAVWPLVLVGAVTFVVIVALAATCGRAWCNNICPVGSFLGIFSRASLFRPVIDADKCIECHSCGKRCRSGCIDTSTRSIDYSRCVDCMDCIDECKVGAIRFRYYGKPFGKETAAQDVKDAGSGKVDEGRRAFMGTVAFLTAAGASQASAFAEDGTVDVKADGGLAPLKPKRIPERSGRLVPFGAGSVKAFYDRCTACQLCVSSCPNGVLRPSGDLEHLLQPQMGYENGYCRPECNICSTVCPAGAILPFQPEEKLIMHIGTAHVDLSLCLVNRDGIECGNCARHCPVGAIRMVDFEGRKVPSVIEDRCTGCGACENLCPSRPISAITVNGLSVHRKD